MGYELEAPAAATIPDPGEDAADAALERRWQLSNERLAAALAGYAMLHGHAGPDDPAWRAAQLRVAQARQRCREASDAFDPVDREEA